MWQCRVCGKKFNKEPIYCSHCGASEEFIVELTPEDSEDFYKGVESSFNTPVSGKSYDEYDDMIKDFLADEYTPVSKKVKKPFEDEDKMKARKKAKEEKLKTIDHEYYESIKSVVGDEGIEKEDYYKSLEDLFKDPINAQQETTFNGLFSRDDTMENTFLKPKKKEKRAERKADKSLEKIRNAPKGADPREDVLVDNDKKNSKLFKILLALVGVFIFFLVLIGVLINNITKTDTDGNLPGDETFVAFFTNIKAMDEATFLSESENLISFVGYDGTVEEKNSQLSELYSMVTSEDFNVKEVKNMTSKGSNRVLVEFNITGNKIAVDTFSQLLFRVSDDNIYKLEFSDFLAKLTIAKEENSE